MADNLFTPTGEFVGRIESFTAHPGFYFINAKRPNGKWLRVGGLDDQARARRTCEIIARIEARLSGGQGQ